MKNETHTVQITTKQAIYLAAILNKTCKVNEALESQSFTKQDINDFEHTKVWEFFDKLSCKKIYGTYKATLDRLATKRFLFSNGSKAIYLKEDNSVAIGCQVKPLDEWEEFILPFTNCDIQHIRIFDKNFTGEEIRKFYHWLCEID